MYENKVNTNFKGKETLKGDSSSKCLSLVMLESVVKAGKKYYPQVFFEEFKYFKIKNQMFNYINDDLEMTSSDDDDDDDDDSDDDDDELYSESDSESDSDSNI